MNKLIKLGLVSLLALPIVGCAKQENVTSENTNTTTETKDTKKQELTNNSEVTKDNFKNFPETDKKYFSYNDWNEGIVIEGCSSEEKAVVVPKEINGKPVLAIGERGLGNMQNCEAIILPDSVRLLGESAFVADMKLKYIHLGTGLKKVSDDAFNGCSSLESITFPEGTETIEGQIFFYGRSLKTITIPASVTEITKLFYFADNCNPDVEIHTPKGSKAEEVANSLGLKVVND